MLRFSLLSCVILIAAFAVASGQTDDALPAPAKKELARLQGKWTIKRFERFGEKVEVEGKNYVLEIKGVQWILGGKLKGNFVAIDPANSPTTFDLRSLEEGRKGQVSEGIFWLDGDTLTICINDFSNGKDRPTSFKTSEKTPNWVLSVLERVK